MRLADGAWFQYRAQGGVTLDATAPPTLRRIGRLLARTCGRLSDDAAWSGTASIDKVFRPTPRRVALLYSQIFLPQFHCVSGLGFTRISGGKPFEPAARQLLGLFHAELQRLWEMPALAPDPLVGLAPRLRQVLGRLYKGQAEKGIAVDLGLSRHTVHNYIKALHRQFNVASRSELLACCRPYRPFRPSLGIEDEHECAARLSRGDA